MHQLLNNITNYKDSIVWQEMTKIKAAKQSSGLKEGSHLRRNFSIRSPLDISKIVDQKSLSTNKYAKKDCDGDTIDVAGNQTMKISSSRNMSIDRRPLPLTDKKVILGSTHNVFGTTAASMLSD